MIADARALVSFAQTLAGGSPPRPPTTSADVPRPARAAPEPGVLVHAVSLHDVSREWTSSTGAPTGTPILVLLDDAPPIPEFLPESANVEPAGLTEEAVRLAIEQRIRDTLGRHPSVHHLVDLVESIQDAVITIDREQTVVYLNAAASGLLQNLTGRTGPFVGQPLGTAFPPALSATTRPAIHDALVHADATRVEDPERHRGIALDIAIFPHPRGATLLVRDATPRRDIEAELIETRLRLARAESLLRARGDGAPA